MRSPLSEADESPILLIPLMWIGDFVRFHTVVRLLNRRFPKRSVDVLTTAMVSPLLDYMPGVRKGIIADLPRRRLAWGLHRALARRLQQERYGLAVVMSRKWKAALAPYLGGIPERVGFIGEARVGLINDLRWGEKRLPRMVDRGAALALEKGQPVPAELPPPVLDVPAAEVAAWRQRLSLPADGRPVVALAPGAVGPAKRWPSESYAELARRLSAEGIQVWILGAPDEAALAAEIAGPDRAYARDLTGPDLRNAILGLAAADAAVSNDSGLLHVAAAIGTPTIGIFGPTSPWHWAPLNPLAAVIESDSGLPCRPCHKPTCRMGHHLCMHELTVDRLLATTRNALAAAGLGGNADATSAPLSLGSR